MWSRDTTIYKNKFLERPLRNINPYNRSITNSPISPNNLTLNLISSKGASIDPNNPIKDNNNKVLTRKEISRIKADPKYRVEV